jgi:hypothetical protein
MNLVNWDDGALKYVIPFSITPVSHENIQVFP